MPVEDKEAFLSRWSRLKRQQAHEAPAPGAPAPGAPAPGAPAPGEEKDAQAPALPPVEELTPESDFAPFMQPKVAQALRRVALKKLFSDPHFNVPDLNEAYSGDWTGGDPISEELLKTLNQGRTVLYREEEAAQAREAGAQETDTAQATDTAHGTHTAALESVAAKKGEAQAAAAGKPKEADGTGRQDA